LQQKGVSDFIGKGLLMANGDAWAHQRRLVAPAFRVERVEVETNFAILSIFHFSIWHDQFIFYTTQMHDLIYIWFCRFTSCMSLTETTASYDGFHVANDWQMEKLGGRRRRILRNRN
jgi:hypothetical protein